MVFGAPLGCDEPCQAGNLGNGGMYSGSETCFLLVVVISMISSQRLNGAATASATSHTRAGSLDERDVRHNDWSSRY